MTGRPRTQPDNDKVIINRNRSNASQMAKTILARRHREEYRILYLKILKEEFNMPQDYEREHTYTKYMKETDNDKTKSSQTNA